MIIRGNTVFTSILKLRSRNVLLDFLIPLACTEIVILHNNTKIINAVCLQEFNV